MTLGVRGVVTSPSGEVLMVEHTYAHGWHLPGGGVERGESVEEALARELIEEAGVRTSAPPVLVGVYDNSANFRGDHVVCFRIDDWVQEEASARGEILARRWAAPDTLPRATSGLTRRLVADALALPGAPAEFRTSPSSRGDVDS
jgi:8-oxo-dGTP pyrophosphatase MutT (NUDIX family)